MVHENAFLGDFLSIDTQKPSIRIISLSQPVAVSIQNDVFHLGIPTPRILKTLQPSRETEMPQHHFRRRLTENQDLLIRYAEYVELASKSELIGMEALFTLGLAERAALWFASSLFYAGINPLEAGDEYLRLNFQVTRTALCNIIYTTKAPLDRLFAELFRHGTLLRMGSERLVRRSDLAAMSE